METNTISPQEIPWTPRDVWLGVACFGLWMILDIFVQVVAKRLGIKVDIGIFIVFGELLLLLPVWGLAILKYKASVGTLGLHRFTIGIVGLGCGLMMLSYGFNIAYSVLFLAPFHLTMQGDLVTAIANSAWSGWLLVGGMIVGPFVEEIFFRGFIFAGLSKVYGWKKSAIISSALFALGHLQWTAFLPIFFMGGIFAYLYHRSRSLWPAILMHISANVIAFSLVYLIHRFT